MGLLTCGPQVRISFWNVQMPLLDFKEKVFPVGIGNQNITANKIIRMVADLIISLL